MEALLSPAVASMARQAESDEQVVSLWLHGRSIHTQRAYRQNIEQFLRFAGTPLQQVTLAQLQAYADSIKDQAAATRNRKLSAVKSLLSFGHRIGYLQFNVGAPLRTPPIKNTLAERILTEADMQRILALETDGRNQVLLRTLYASGGRVSEICGIRWHDLQERIVDGGQIGGQITLYGKGGKTRVVLLSVDSWKALQSLKNDAGPEDPVFRSRKGGSLNPSQVWRIVAAAARRAGIDGKVSPHWFRHSHASHALDRGCPIHLVQATLGHSSVATTGRYLHVRPEDSSARYLAV